MDLDGSTAAGSCKAAAVFRLDRELPEWRVGGSGVYRRVTAQMRIAVPGERLPISVSIDIERW
jgi:hypothetical protein